MASEMKNSPDPDFPKKVQNQDGDPELRDKKRGSRGNFIPAASIVVIIFAVLLVIGLAPRLLNQPMVAAAAKRERDSAPSVYVTQPQKSPGSDTLSLPGNINAIQQTSIYARSTGYLQRWLVDMGDKVQAGQLVAVIQSPEVDQQLNQAKAQLAQARAAVAQSRANFTSSQGDLAQQQANLSHAQAQYAQAEQSLSQNRDQYAQAVENNEQQKAQLTLAQANLDLAKVTAQRYQNLAKEGAIDQQTADQTQASYLTNRANVQSLEAAVRASKSNIDSFEAGVHAGEANVKAFADGIKAAQAAVKTAQANVLSARAAVASAQANADSNAANVAHAAVLTSYERVTAPFSGVITARNVDTGALISGGGASSSSASVGGSSSGVSVSGNAASGGGSNGSTGQANSGSLFSIAELDKLRVYINIPQTYAVGIYTGQSAQVTFHEYPNRKFNGKITRTASALDPATRTLVAEVQLANRNDMLRPGMFAQVELKVKHTSASLLAPDNAIITGAAGVRVATVTPQNTIHFQPVSVGRDYGSLIEILSGLKGNETVLTDPDTSLQEGEKVNPVPQKKT